MRFTLGDVVKLKSGGPEMTVSKPGRGVLVRGVNVEGVEGRESVWVFCKWFEKGKPRTASFNPEDLEFYKPEQEQKRELGYK
ncbi:unnamed protein product [marine sediment metagenome]|uniref:DUF2158 domain-containing protein n=1 Tax=marine sediment metagenome TaxID=412755 RepID=X1DRW3_9ZZZZ